ncbi:hypothetical protein [Actinopolymorpha pittospori]|uniref:MYXO-CTERM domain-containing protein n=1 Tax=Actinopolymorpha pittospori TaxID=648752 RepID=A0A927MN01_9ACTN|nr:hypothetical protein [Actinopolymorpha pittospori]MBE1603236.1 hypothetical protein [Actinopolymorpha pittospori]
MGIRKTFGVRVGAAVVAAGLVTVVAPTAAMADGGDANGHDRRVVADRPIMDKDKKDAKYDDLMDCIKAAREAKAADGKDRGDKAAEEGKDRGDKAAEEGKDRRGDKAAAGKDDRRGWVMGPNTGGGSTASDKADCKYIAKPGPGTGDGSTATGGAGSATAVGGALLGLALTAGIVVLRRRNDGAAAA